MKKLFLFFFAVLGFISLIAQSSDLEDPIPSSLLKQFNDLNHAAIIQKELKEGGDIPFLRMKHFFDQRLTADGPNPISDRWEVYKKYKSPSSVWLRNDVPIPNWENLGPNTLRGFAGRMISIAFDPLDEELIWAGSAEGGLWRSENGGNNWQAMTDDLPAVGVSSIAINPQNGNEIIIGTGEGKSQALTFKPGIGVLKSLDKGQTWKSTSFTFNQRAGVSTFDMAWDPFEVNRIYLAASNGFWVSEDSGQNWSLKRAGKATSIIIDPKNQGILYVAMQGDGIYKSSKSGDELFRLTIGLPSASQIGLTSLAISASNPDILLASITSVTNNRLLGLYKTVNGISIFCRLLLSPTAQLHQL